MKVRMYRPRSEWGFGLTKGSGFARIGAWRVIWLIEWEPLRTPTFSLGGDGYWPQWLIPIPFASTKPWILITWTWPPSVNRL